MFSVAKRSSFLTIFRSLTHGDVRYEDSESDVGDVGGVTTLRCQSYKTFSVVLTKRQNKLDRLSLASLSSLFYYYWVRPGAYLSEDYPNLPEKAYHGKNAIFITSMI